jgi:GTP cyclohydrolase II
MDWYTGRSPSREARIAVLQPRVVIPMHYQLPGAILQYFGLKSVRLLSNNPEKVDAVERAGIQVVERIPCRAAQVDSTDAYLRTKKTKMGHLLESV